MEMRDDAAYIMSQKIKGAGGLPWHQRQSDVLVIRGGSTAR